MELTKNFQAHILGLKQIYLLFKWINFPIFSIFSLLMLSSFNSSGNVS